MDILKQFRRNNQSVAIVINNLGQAIGIITLDTLIEKIIRSENLIKPLKPDINGLEKKAIRSARVKLPFLKHSLDSSMLPS